MRSFLILLHLAGVIVWVGGMFFAHFCLRPSAAQLLPPPQRLPLMAATLGRFFKAVSLAIGLILVSGVALFMMYGASPAPWPWHLMALCGLIMAGVFIDILRRPFRRLREAVAAEDWPTGGAAMDGIRLRVSFNLMLASITIAAAVMSPVLI